MRPSSIHPTMHPYIPHPSLFVLAAVRKKFRVMLSLFISFLSIFCSSSVTERDSIPSHQSKSNLTLGAYIIRLILILNIRNPSFYWGLLTSSSLDPLFSLSNHSLPNVVYLPTQPTASVALCFPATQTRFYLICPYNRHE